MTKTNAIKTMIYQSGKEIGDNRASSLHVMLHLKCSRVGSLAKSFGVPENYVEAWRGASVFRWYSIFNTSIQGNIKSGKHRYEREWK